VLRILGEIESRTANWRAYKRLRLARRFTFTPTRRMVSTTASARRIRRAHGKTRAPAHA